MNSLQGRDFLSLTDLSSSELFHLLDQAAELKAGTLRPQCRQVLGLLFSKASTRTRVSFSVAMYQIGGQVLDLNPLVSQVSRGEPWADTARVLDRYLDVIAIRTFKQEDLTEFAHYARIPVINALTDLGHPCQILADLLTIREHLGFLAGKTLAYLGDGNNVANSLLLGCAMAGMHIRVATPRGYEPNPQVVTQAQHLALAGNGVLLTTDPQEAIEGAQVVYTDVWASMGQEAQAQDRAPLFEPYQVNSALMKQADPRAIVLHCLPAHRGEEITTEVLEGPQSRVWDQAENRLHAQKSLLVSLLGAS